MKLLWRILEILLPHASNVTFHRVVQLVHRRSTRLVVVLLPIDTIDDPGATLFPITGFNSDLYIPGDGIPLQNLDLIYSHGRCTETEIVAVVPWWQHCF